MKLLSVILLCFLLSGCGFFDRYVVANVTGYSVQCVYGVQYLQFPSGVSVAYDTNGKIKVCQ
jgi:hypothetical protein